MGGGRGEGLAIGIDLGTTYSCVAVWDHDHVEVIVNDQGNRTTPSYVAFTDTETLVGDAAFNQIIKNPTNSIFGTLFFPKLLPFVSQICYVFL
jgi:L1 cell adhesion molecule like protein